MNEPTSKQQKRTTILIVLLALLTLICICVTVWALFFREPTTILPPDYAPVQTEPNQTPIKDDNSGDKLEAEDGGGAVSLTYASKVTIDLSEEKARLYFANPGESTQDIVVQIVVQDTVLVQSGRLTPGNEVTTLDLLDGAAKKLAAGGYDGKFVISYYDQETREKAVVNTEIPITITVQK